VVVFAPPGHTGTFSWPRTAFGPPKSDAGRRTVGFPELIVPVLREHLGSFARPGDDGLVFAGSAGALLRRSNFRRRTWLPALRKAGLPIVHFHDLRHTGDNLTAAAGANLRQLMARMGQTSTRAALIYLHSPTSGSGRSPTLSGSSQPGS
jgi:integrase